MTPISPESPEPLYLQLAKEIRDSIRRGELRPGEHLPPERDLSDTYGVSRTVIRQALGLLKAEALIGSGPGRGTFVRSPPPVRFRFTRHGLSAGVSPWQHAMAQAGVEASGRLTGLETAPASPQLAQRFGLEEGDPVLTRRGEMLAGGFVAQLYVATYPLWRVYGTELVEREVIPDGIYAALERAGIVLETASDEIGARAPTPEEAAALRLSPGIPVLTVARTAYDASEQPVEYLETVSNAEMLLLCYEGLALGQPQG